jgi:hypothetical protein
MRRLLVGGVVTGALMVGFALPASGFEPPADPQDKFTCPKANLCQGIRVTRG